MKAGDGNALERIKEIFSNIYFSLEDKYYSLVDWLVGRGIPADKLVEAIESKGIPSFPVFVIAILLILGGAIWGISSAFGPKEYVITVYGPDGTPLAYTKVYVNGEAYVTDGFGQLHLKGIEPPVTVSVPGYEDFEWDPDVGDIYLEPVTKTVRISVKDKSTGKSITAVKITVHGKEESKEFDEAPVEFKIAKVPTEDAITVDEDGYVTVEVISAIYGKTTEKINWNDSAGMVIEKTIYLGRDETAKAGRIVVNIKPENVEGKAYLYRNDMEVMGPLAFRNGVVTFYSVLYGEYEVVLHPVINGTEFSDPANTIYVSHHSRETEASITLVLPGYDGESDEYTPPENLAKYYITVKVMDKETGKPIEGAKIHAKGISGVLAKTNAQGVATVGFSDENTEYNVYVAHPDYSPSEWFVISPKDKKTYEVELEPLPDIGTLKINVVDPSGPVPKAFYQIYLKEGEEKKLILTGNTDEEGKATVKVPAGTLIVKAAYLDGSFPTEKEVNVSKGEEKEITVFLSSKVNITINVYSLETGDRISSLVRAVDSEGMVWAEGTTTPYSGAILEVPAKWEIRFVVKYGENGEYITDFRTFNESESVDLYVPTEEKTEAKLIGIFDNTGNEIYMLGKGETYSARFLLVCSGSCTFTFSSSDGIKLSGESSKKLSCGGKVCATEISIPIEVDSDKVYGKGTLSVSWSGGSEDYKIPYGFELSSADCSGNLCARVIAMDGTTEADTTKLDVGKIYTFYTPFAAKDVGDSPTVEVETGDLRVTEEPQGQPIATISDWTVGIVAFSGTMFEKGGTEISITVEDVLSKIFTLRFRDESDLPELEVEITPDVIIKGCSSYKIHYTLKDSEGNPATGNIMLAYVDNQSYELPGAEGDLEIPTTSDSIEITFYVSNYREKTVTLETTPVTVTGEGDVVLTEAGKWTAGTVTYEADGPEGISVSTEEVEQADENPYYITIKSTSFSSSGSATLYVEKNADTISNTSIIKNVTQNATLSYSGSTCSIEIPVEITIHEGGGSGNVSGKISVFPKSPTTKDDIKVTISASTENPGATIERIDLSVSGANYSKSYSCEGKSSCEFDVGKLSAGSYVLSATAKDSTGDTWSGSKSIEVLPEETGDVSVKITNITQKPCEGVTISVLISGISDIDPTKIQILVNGHENTPQYKGSNPFEFKFGTDVLIPGKEYTIRAAYIDPENGHVGYSDTTTIPVQTCEPKIDNVRYPKDGICENESAKVSAHAVVPEDCEICLDGDCQNGLGVQEYRWTVSDAGKHTIEIKCNGELACQNNCKKEIDIPAKKGDQCKCPDSVTVQRNKNDYLIVQHCDEGYYPVAIVTGVSNAEDISAKIQGYDVRLEQTGITTQYVVCVKMGDEKKIGDLIGTLKIQCSYDNSKIYGSFDDVRYLKFTTKEVEVSQPEGKTVSVTLNLDNLPNGVVIDSPPVLIVYVNNKMTGTQRYEGFTCQSTDNKGEYECAVADNKTPNWDQTYYIGIPFKVEGQQFIGYYVVSEDTQGETQSLCMTSNEKITVAKGTYFLPQIQDSTRKQIVFCTKKDGDSCKGPGVYTWDGSKLTIQELPNWEATKELMAVWTDPPTAYNLVKLAISNGATVTILKYMYIVPVYRRPEEVELEFKGPHIEAINKDWVKIGDICVPKEFAPYFWYKDEIEDKTGITIGDAYIARFDDLMIVKNIEDIRTKWCTLPDMSKEETTNMKIPEWCAKLPPHNKCTYAIIPSSITQNPYGQVLGTKSAGYVEYYALLYALANGKNFDEIDKDPNVGEKIKEIKDMIDKYPVVMFYFAYEQDRKWHVYGAHTEILSLTNKEPESGDSIHVWGIGKMTPKEYKQSISCEKKRPWWTYKEPKFKEPKNPTFYIYVNDNIEKACTSNGKTQIPRYFAPADVENVKDVVLKELQHFDQAFSNCEEIEIKNEYVDLYQNIHELFCENDSENMCKIINPPTTSTAQNQNAQTTEEEITVTPSVIVLPSEGGE